MRTEQTTVAPDELHKGMLADFFSGTTLFWERVYEENGAGINPFFAYAMTKRKDQVLALLDEAASGRTLDVLDAGCGTGVVLEEVLRRGHRTTGIDISPAMVEEANRRLSPATSRPVCGCGDIERMTFADASFDVALSLGVIMYLPTDDAALEELRRVVRPGGAILLVLPNLARLNMFFDPYYLGRALSFFRRRLGKGARPDLTPDDFSTNRTFTNRRYTPGGLRKLFRRHGFTRFRFRGIDYGPLTFGGREILSPERSVRLSERLAAAADMPGLHWLHRLAGQWVITLERP